MHWAVGMSARGGDVGLPGGGWSAGGWSARGVSEHALGKGVLKGLFVRECAEGSQCSRKTLCVCVCMWGNVLASGERGFQE